jgi:hypothetical protein
LEVLKALVTAHRGDDEGRGDLSGRLAATLERDERELMTLPVRWQRLEVARLVNRHGGAEVGPGLLGLARYAGAEDDESGVPARAAAVARFVAAESRWPWQVADE